MRVALYTYGEYNTPMMFHWEEYRESPDSGFVRVSEIMDVEFIPRGTEELRAAKLAMLDREAAKVAKFATVLSEDHARKLAALEVERQKLLAPTGT
jgi:hypothetical protein